MKLNSDDIDKIIKRKKKGLSSIFVAKQFKISKRRVNQLFSEYEKLGSNPILQKQGRKAIKLYSKGFDDKIFSLNSEHGFGANYIAQYLRKKEKVKIANDYVHSVLLANNRAKPNPKKQRRRKPWIRYEKAWSLDMVHMDWHFNSATQLWLCAVLDDKSRKILSTGEFKQELMQYNIGLLKQAFSKYKGIKHIEVCLTDRGSQFYASKKEKKAQGITHFQKCLARLNVKHSKCRYKHPQTNGKLEKWNHTYELHRHKFETLEEFMEWYNNRPHGSLDFQTPKQVFWEALIPWTLGKFIKMVEGDLSGK